MLEYGLWTWCNVCFEKASGFVIRAFLKVVLARLGEMLCYIFADWGRVCDETFQKIR